jgi:hypothetical protein
MANSESPETRQVKETIRQWLNANYDMVETYTLPVAHWAFKATRKRKPGRQILVWQPLADDSAVIIATATKIPQGIQDKLSARSQDERKNFSVDLILDLLRLNVELAGDIADPLEEVSVVSKVFLDGLSRDNFEQRVLRLNNAITTVHLHIARVTGAPINSIILHEPIN